MSDSLFLDIVHILPQLVLAVGALSIMLFSTFRKELPLALYSSLTVFVALCFQCFLICSECSNIAEAFGGILSLSNISGVLNSLILIATFISVTHFSLISKGKGAAEKVVLMLFSAIGALTLLVSNQIIVWYLSLELMSLSAYALLASNLKSPASAESALRYFVLGALSSALIIFGFACLYGFSAETNFFLMANALSNQQSGFILLGFGLIIAGLAFKIGLFPFHFWVPDVYQSAEKGVAVFLASVLKLAAAGSLFIFLATFSSELNFKLNQLIWVLAALSMLAGNLLALLQDKLKRLIAYSAIAHSGYFAIAFLDPISEVYRAAFLNYLVLYTILTCITFVVVDLIQKDSDDDVSILSLKGFAKENSFLAAILTINLLALAGLPPLIFGLMSKIYLLTAALQASLYGIAIILVIGAVIGCYYYLRLIGLIYSQPEDQSEKHEIHAYWFQLIALTALVFTLLYYSVFPGRLYNFLLNL